VRSALRLAASGTLAIALSAWASDTDVTPPAGADSAAPEPQTREPFAWELPPAAAVERPIVDASRLHRDTLANGLQVIVLEDRRLPEFSAGFVALRGAAIESTSETGLATFTASLMERGAGERDALALAAAVDDLGADLSVKADWDSLRVSISGLSRDFDALFGVLIDVVLRPRFGEADAVRAVAEQRAALAAAQDDPARLALQHLMRALYGAHRFATPLAGTDAGVSGFHAGSARAFHTRVVTPASGILWVAGDVDARVFLARAKRVFGGWRGAEPVPLPEAPPIPEKRRVVLVDRPALKQAQIAIGHEGIARTDPRRLEAQLLNTAFGAGGFSSRLMNRIRAQEGLTYGVFAQLSQYRVPGPFVISTFTRIPEVGRLLASAFEEMERVRTDPPAGVELERARSLRTGAYPLALETTEAVMAALLDLEVYGLPRDTLDTYRPRMRAISAEGVAQAALEIVHPERATIVVVGPTKALLEPLSVYGAVEIVAP
jgi:zinc protease